MREVARSKWTLNVKSEMGIYSNGANEMAQEEGPTATEMTPTGRDTRTWAAAKPKQTVPRKFLSCFIMVALLNI